MPAEGWFATMPARFKPELVDTMVDSYNVEIAIRHSNKYPYRNLSLVVDLIGSRIDRRQVQIELADAYGNWLGAGFGALYQVKKTVVTDVPRDDLKSVIVWQSLKNCDSIQGIENVGLIITPVKK